MELKKYTRKIDREYQNILMEDMSIDPNTNTPKINMSNLQEANDFLVMKMWWYTQEQVDEMDVSEYNKIIEEINKIKSPITVQEKKN